MRNANVEKKSSHNVHLLVLVHNISRLYYVEVGDHNLVLAPTSILAVIYSSELEKVSLDFWSGVVVFLIRHHHVTFKSSELERYTLKQPLRAQLDFCGHIELAG